MTCLSSLKTSCWLVVVMMLFCVCVCVCVCVCAFFLLSFFRSSRFNLQEAKYIRKTLLFQLFMIIC